MNVLLLCPCIRYEGHTQSAECGLCLTAITGDCCGDNHVFVPQTYACRDKYVMSRPYLCGDKYLSRQKDFVATKSGKNTLIIGGSCHKHSFCRDKNHVFVATKHIFYRDKSMLLTTKLLTGQMFCCDKHVFDTTKVLSRQTRV